MYTDDKIQQKHINTIRKAVEKTKEKIIQKVKSKGMYENLGQKECGMLYDKYISGKGYNYTFEKELDKHIQGLSNRAMNYNG